REDDREKGDVEDLAHQGGRRRSAPEAIADVEDEVVEEASEEEPCRQPDREEPVLATVGVRHPHAASRESEHDRGHDREEGECGKDPAGAFEQVRKPSSHRCEILSATTRGSPDSWKSRTAAMPVMRSAYGSREPTRSSSIPPIA